MQKQEQTATIDRITENKRSRSRLDVSRLTEEESAFMAFIDENMVGQPAAKRAALRIHRAIHNPLRDPNRPIFSVILAGESRTGKTHLVRLLARWFHSDEKAMVKVNGGEFQERYALNRLIGSPHGYIGFNDANDSARKPRDGKKDTSALLSQHNLDQSRRGSSRDVTFVLFDEWEKMHGDMINLLLAGLDEGEFTLANNEDVNFRNVVVVMTSNMGMKELEASMSSIGFNNDRATGRKPSAVEVEASVQKAYRQKSSPEFRNRIDMLVVYESLSATQLSDIINLEIIQVQKRVMAVAPDRLFVLKASEGARDFLLKRAIASEDGGLANLKRQLNESLLEPLGTALNLGLVKMGDLVEIDVENGELVFDVLSGGMEVDAFSRIPILGQGEVDLSTTEARQAFFSPAHVSLAPGMPLSGYATIGGALLNLSELMFLQRAVELKALARFQSPFLADYELRLSDKDDLDRLTGRAFSLVRDLTDLMGVKVLASETTYQPPFSVSLRVRALPGQIDLLRLRYSEISIELIN